nr:hypothetical protein [Tanacetum cinerariifolium]
PNLEQDKIAQALEIIKLKKRVRKLEKKRKLTVFRLKRLRNVGTTQRIKSSTDTVMDDQEDASKQGGIIVDLDADKEGKGFSGVETPLFKEELENLEQDKIAQALEIIKLKKRVRKLEKKRKLTVSRLKRLRNVGTTQRIESSTDTVMDDQEDASKQGGIIVDLDADKYVTLEEVEVKKTVKVEKNADVHGRHEESQAEAYHIDLEHVDKVLSMHEDEPKPAELQKVIEVVTTTKLMTEVIIAAAPITTATITTAPNKGKGIMVEEPKTLKKQARIEHDEAYARELEAELNKNINWDDVIEQVQRKEKEDNVVLRYPALKRKPQTEAQARKNMIVYLKNMVGFKMDYFKGMSYDNIRPIFEKYFNSNVAFLEKSKEQLEEEESGALKRTSESLEEKAAKKQKLDEEPKNFSDDFLLTTLTYMFEKPDVEAQVWKNQRGVHGLANVKSCRLLESRRVHIITFTTTQMVLLVERRYPLTRFTLEQMLNNVRLEVEEESEVSLELLKFVRKQQQEGYRPE